MTVTALVTSSAAGGGGGAAGPGVGAGGQGRVDGAGQRGAAAPPRHLHQPRHRGGGAAGQVVARYI